MYFCETPFAANNLVAKDMKPAENMRKNESLVPEEDVYIANVHRIILGDKGRAKLKSLISQRVRADSNARLIVQKIGKIRVAPVYQLLEMAKAIGMWDFAQENGTATRRIKQ